MFSRSTVKQQNTSVFCAKIQDSTIYFVSIAQLSSHGAEMTGAMNQAGLTRLLQCATAGGDHALEELIGKYRPLLRLVADRYARRLL